VVRHLEQLQAERSGQIGQERHDADRLDRGPLDGERASHRREHREDAQSDN
jgi:hypothetical protein